MKRLAFAAMLLTACVDPDPEPELVWNVSVTSSNLVVGQSTPAASVESLPSGDSPMPLVANWYASPEGIVQLSSDVGSTISVKGLVPGNVLLFVTAGGLQGGTSREVSLRVLAP